MDVPLLEQLACLLAQGRRDAQRLRDAAGGRYRERAIPREHLRAADDATRTPHRMLCGDPTLSLAALLSEQGQGHGPDPDAVCVDLHPALVDEPLVARFARWIPRLFLLQALGPQADCRVRALAEDHAALRLVLDAAWPRAVIDDAGTPDATAMHAFDAGRVVLVLADDAARCGSLLPDGASWITCVGDDAMAAQVRHACLSSGAALDIASVGATPGEWARRHAGGKPVDAMRAALAAFGATPLAQSNAGTTPTGRRRAGMEVLLGQCARDGLRTLVWVDAPDRRTSDATLCRAITRRDMGAPPWDRVVILGWHFVPTFAQHLALHCDARIEAFAIGLQPSTGRRSARPAVDPDGFRPMRGLAAAWIDRERSRSQRDAEWVTVQLRDDHDAALVDWSIDPDHDGDVFRGRWHASRDGDAALRTARVRVPWQPGPRRVCIRAIDAAGGISEVMSIARHRPDEQAPWPLPGSAATQAPVEALC